MTMIIALLALSVTLPVVTGADDNVRAEIARALRDAESRSSLLLKPATAGYDDGFFIADESDAFHLDIAGRIQTRWMGVWRDEDGGVDPFTSGVHMRRVKFTLSGHVFDDSIRFRITQDFSRKSGRARLSTATLDKRFENGVTIRAGQFLLPFTRESLDSSKRQLAVDRSLVNSAFGIDRSQGVRVGVRGDGWRAWTAFSDGDGGSNSDFGADSTDWAVSGRIEWIPFGANKWFRSQAGAIDAESSLRLGSAMHVEERGASPGDVGGRMVAWTGDVAAVGSGWTALATLVGRESADTTGTEFTDWGITAQFGLWVTESIVPFARWELLIPDGDRAGDSKTNVLTFGTNWYIHGEALKFTIDGVWLVDGAGSNDLIRRNTGVGVLDPGTGDSEFVLRAQMQLLF